MTHGTSPGESLAFPAGFTWGAATAAYQIEGAPDADGKGPSVWDTFSHTPGKVRGGDTGDVACDSYRRYAQDADLVRSLGLGAYRFSISWPRVFPNGAGKVNQAGLDHYRALADALGERGIAAMATLFHWDLPQALQDNGGWAVRDTALRFADYAAVVGEALGDRVAQWITLNEPQVVVDNGYRTGVHAPGLRDAMAAAAATHHLLLGHGLAAAALRAAIGSTAPVGIALSMTQVRAVSDKQDEQTLPTTRKLELARRITDASVNGVFLEPLLTGRYPGYALPVLLPPDGLIADGDMAAIAAPIDFLGVNYYQPVHLRPGDPDSLRRGEEPPLPGIRGVVQYRPDGMEQTSMGWLVDPDGLYELLLRLSKDAPGLPLYVTENGCAAEDYVNPEGTVYDVERIRYLHRHLDAAARAIRDGANLAGYFVWSLLDNFEWAYGYQKRFGIVYVDFATQRRIPKASSRFYADVARANVVPPAVLPRSGTESAAAEDLVESARDLGGEVGGPRLRSRGIRLRSRVPDQAAVQAFDLVEPPDQVRASATGATRKVRERDRDTVGADEHLVLAYHAPAPRAAFPCLGVHLPRAAPVTRHLETLPSKGPLQPSREGAQRLLVVGDVARLRDGVDHLPAHHAFLVDDERAPQREAALLIEYPVGLGDRPVRPEVREQGELEVLRVGPRPVGEEGVHRHRDQFHVVLADLGEVVAEPAHLVAAHRAERQRVEHEHHVLLTAEARQLHRSAVLVGKLEVRGLITDLNCHA
jgi:beta-glucosidase